MNAADILKRSLVALTTSIEAQKATTGFCGAQVDHLEYRAKEASGNESMMLAVAASIAQEAAYYARSAETSAFCRPATSAAQIEANAAAVVEANAIIETLAEGGTHANPWSVGDAAWASV